MTNPFRENEIQTKKLTVQNELILGATPVIATGADLNLLADVTATADEINLLDGQPAAIVFTVGTQAGDVINVGLQVNDAAGAAMAVRSSFYAYLSDDANGDTIAGTAPDGGIAIGTDGLAVPLVADKAFMLTSEADGDIDLNITESGADTWYLVVRMPTGKLLVSAAITFA